MHRIVILVLGAVALAVLSAIAPVELNAQSNPDFSGVYYPVQQGRGGAGGTAAAAPPAGQRGTPPRRQPGLLRPATCLTAALRTLRHSLQSTWPSGRSSENRG